MRYVIAALALMGAAAPATARMVQVNYSGEGYSYKEFANISGSFWYDSNQGGCINAYDYCLYPDAIHDFHFQFASVDFSNLSSTDIVISRSVGEISFQGSTLDGATFNLRLNLPSIIDADDLPLSLPQMNHLDSDLYYNSGGDDPVYYVIGELSTFTLIPVPEPATWAMMIGGFGLVGASLRSRKALLA